MAAPTVSYTGQYKMTESGNNWELRLLTSGTLSLSKGAAVDVFLVGGGGGGGSGDEWQRGGGGGGGGYTKTQPKLRLTKNTAYAVTVGAGGGNNAAGGTTSAFGLSAGGGAAGARGTSNRMGGAGGSGGGTGAYIDQYVTYYSSGNGGSDGSNGGTVHGSGGAGQGSTTRAFGESGGELFSGGGGGGSAVTSNYINGYYGTRNSGGLAPGGSGGGGRGADRLGHGSAATANTGGGGGGGGCNALGGAGGSGIVILRNTRYGATTLVSAKSGVFGSPIQISLSRDDASAVHTLKAELLNAAGSTVYTETIAEKTAEYPTISWTPGEALYAPLVKNAASARFQIKCYTYIDGDEQGEEELDAPISVSFRAESMSPEMGEGCVTVSPYNAGAAAGISCFVQGYSMADGSFDDSLITLKYGAGIAKREIICGGVSNATPPYRTGPLTGVSELTAKVTDSRGFTAQRKITVSPEPYAKPRLSEIEIFRSDAAGTADAAGGRICLKATAAVSSLAGENTLSLSAAIRTKYGSYGAEESFESGAATVLSGSASPDETIYVRLTARDRLGETTQFEQMLSPRKWAMKFRENGEGVAFGKAPSADKVLEIAEDWEIKRGQKILPWEIAKGSVTKSMLAPDVTAAALGGFKITKLWENTNPSVPFAAQTLNLTGAARKFYIVVLQTATYDSITECAFCPNTLGTTNRLTSSWAYEYLVVSWRSMYIESGTKVRISSNRYQTHKGTGAEDNTLNIPLQIYGVNY